MKVTVEDHSPPAATLLPRYITVSFNLGNRIESLYLDSHMNSHRLAVAIAEFLVTLLQKG